MKLKQALGFLVPITALGALAGLFYFLLPVSPQSLLSADHVRWVFSSGDISPVLPSSLSSVWAALLWIVKSVGLGAEQTFATSAALSAWISLGAFAVLWRYLPKSALMIVALTPAVLWSSVVPNGTSVNLLVLALIGIWCSPEMTIERSRTRWTLGAVLEGLGCALTLFAWPLAIARAFLMRKVSVSKNIRLLRIVLFFVGFSFPMALAVLMDATLGDGSSFSKLPVFSILNLVGSHVSLGAGRVIFGGIGEVYLGYLASLTFMAAAFYGPGWTNSTKPYRRSLGTAFLALSLSLFFVIGHPKAWRLAHPGWNTVLEDFALNIERGVNKPTIAIVHTATEEAVIRYVDAILEKKPKVIALSYEDLLTDSAIARVKLREPRFSSEEWIQELKEDKGEERDQKKIFVEKFIAPNTARGVQFWLDFPPDRNEGLEVQFLAMGIRVSGITGPTKFLTDREPLRASYVRAHPTLREWLAGPSLETDIFSRYAMYHIAVARILERAKQTPDWERRARGEYYSALKKVEWLKDIHQKVCVDPIPQDASAGSAGATKPEPVDICTDLAWYYGPV